MAVTYDVVATIGSYVSDGQTKYNNRKVGVILETQHGPSLKLDASFNPAGCMPDDSGSVWLKLFPPREKQAAQITNIQSQLDNNDIPFG